MFGSLDSLPAIPLAPAATPVEDMSQLRAALGGGPRLLIKRDDLIGFAFGGNKVRKMRLVAADALRSGADTLITSGGVQSNHARVTAATAARLGLRCVLVANGTEPAKLTANALLDRLLGAEVRYVPSREARPSAVLAACEELRRLGREPYVVPVGASTPLGAAAYVLAFAELLRQVDPPDLIIHATSSGGTQAGLVAACALTGVKTRVIGISADEKSEVLAAEIRRIADGVFELAGKRRQEIVVEVDDRFVGQGYGISTDASREALSLTARSEAIFLDPTYTAKAMAGLVERVRNHSVDPRQTVLFWHTGGQVGLFADN